MFLVVSSTSTQGHADLDHENNACSIISETVQVMPITFAVKIVWLKWSLTVSWPGPLHKVATASQTW